MRFSRYSATSMFGAPIDDLERLIQPVPDRLERIIGHMTAYGIEAEPLPVGLTDITPFYGTQNKLRYYLNFDGSDSVEIHLMPNVDGGAPEMIEGPEPDVDLLRMVTERTIVLPTDEQIFALAGGSPRFDQMCIHELIVSHD